MTTNRKLQGEIDRTLKKIYEGITEFDNIMGKIQTATNANLKEKHENDLKREIKKLQRLREQVKNWIGLNEVKNKNPLAEARKKIESEMERYKRYERASKTKEYSDEGLRLRLQQKRARHERPQALEKWLEDSLQTLKTQVSEFEQEIASLEKKQVGDAEAEELEEDAMKIANLDERIERHKAHIETFTAILLKWKKKPTKITKIEKIKPLMDEYLEAKGDGDYGEESPASPVNLYSDLNLDSPDQEDGDEEGELDDEDDIDGEVWDEEPQDGDDVDVNEIEQEPAEKLLDKGQVEKVDKVVTAEKVDPAPKEQPVTKARDSDEGNRSTPVQAAPAKTKPQKTGSNAALEIPQNTTGTPTPAQRGKKSSQSQISTQSQSQSNTSQTQTTTSVSNTSAPTQPSPTQPSNSQPQKNQATKTQSTSSQPSSNVKDPALSSSSTTVSATSATSSTTPASPASASTSVAPKATKQTGKNSQANSTQTASTTATSTSNPPKEEPSVPSTSPAPASSAQSEVPNQPVATPAVPSPVPPLATLAQRQVAANNSAELNEIKSLQFSSLPGQVEVNALSADRMKALTQSMQLLPEAEDTVQPKQYHPTNPYTTPDCYPSAPLNYFDDPAMFEKFDTDTLFFIFYYQQGTYQQYLAAKELKRQSWRYHKKYLTWFQRHEEPKEITPDYEQGTYIYFDYETGWCQRKKTEFTFEYRYLEDKDLV